MQEQRLTSRLMKYWNMIRKTERFPDIGQLNPGAIEDLWPSCFKVAVQDTGKIVYKYEYIGAPVVAIYGLDLTGKIVDDRMKQFPGTSIIKKLGEVLAGAYPVEDEGFFVNGNGKLVKYRACLLPFGNEKKGITHIIVGMSYRLF